MKNLTFITGAARSGKSLLAEELARNSGRKVFYLATMQVFDTDSEQVRRLQLHRARRPAEWKTIDAAFGAEKIIGELPDSALVIFDCLSLYITNMLISNSAADVPGSKPVSLDPSPGSDEDPYFREASILENVDALLCAIENKSTSEFIVVSNEVGWGVVPESKLARAFRDILGLSNQRVAAASHKAYLTCAGLRIELK